MPLILFILRLLLDLLVGWWREAAPLAVRRDGRVQTWQDDDATEAAVGLVGFRWFSRLTAPPGTVRPVRRSSTAGANGAGG